MGGLRRIGLWGLRALVLLLGLWTAFRLLGLESGYPLVALVAFTPYVTALAVIGLAIAVYARRWPEAMVALVAVGLLAFAVLPRAFPGQPTQAIEGGVRLDVMTLNFGLGEADAAEVAAVARGSGIDLLSAQELTGAAARRLRREGIDDLLPEQELQPAGGSAGAGLYSRYPLRRLPAVPGGVSRMVRAGVRVTGAARIEAVAVHPYPPTERNAASWQEGLEALPSAGAGATLRILPGDFNATFDHAQFRDLVGTGYVDAAAARGLGLAPTWPTDRRWTPPVTIDHVLADERVHVAGAEVIDIAETDHRAVLAALLLPAAERQ